MNDYVDCNLSREVLDTMLIAQKISKEFQEREITALDFFLASLEYSDTSLLELIIEAQPDITSQRLAATPNVVAIMSNKSMYQKYVAKSYEVFLEAKKKKEENQQFIVEGILKQDILTLETYMLVMDLEYGLSQDLEKALSMAEAICEQIDVPAIQLDDLLYCIISNENSRATKYIAEQYKVNVKELKVDLGNTLGIEGLVLNQKELAKQKSGNNYAIVKQPLQIPESIKNCVTNLNSKFSKGKCDIMGRDDEIYEVWNIISKKTKRNAILIGEPGVGKSAIVEAITYSILNGTCPKEYKNYTVIELNLNSMVAGTHYRGDFEAKVQDLIDFIEKKDNLIVFVDEIHQIIGAGNAEGSGPDLAGSIKPILARDDVVFIGATTMDEYRRIFDSDGALSRRFERVVIEEPKGKKLRDMIKGRVKTLSDFHNVTCTQEMLENVIVSASSFNDIANPDRTIDLLDKSMAVAKIDGDKALKLEHIQKVYRRFFKQFDTYTVKQKRITAYHEAGHFVAWLLSKTKVNEKCTLISIVPAFHWAGVTMFDRSDKIDSSGTMQLLRDSISIGVAGRIAQQFVEKAIDTGASSDIQNLVAQIEEYFLNCGMDEKYKNYAFNDDSKLMITDEVTADIRQRTQDLINEVYAETQKLLEENKDGLDRVAKLLYENKIITATQAKRAFYNKGRKKKGVKIEQKEMATKE